MTYALYLISCDPIYKKRSPSAPLNPKTFYVMPHFVAGALVKWLVSHGVDLGIDEVEKRYRALQALPDFPIDLPPPKGVSSYQAQYEGWIADLRRIDNLLKKSAQNDPLSIELRNWHQACVRFTKEENFQESLLTYIPKLQNLLQDSLWQIPLDARAFLGSDGHLYGEKSLSVYLSCHGVQITSPVDKDNVTPFTVKPHVSARFLVELLQTRNAYIPCKELDELYNVLKREKRLPKLPIEKVAPRVAPASTEAPPPPPPQDVPQEETPKDWESIYRELTERAKAMIDKEKRRAAVIEQEIQKLDVEINELEEEELLAEEELASMQQGIDEERRTRVLLKQEIAKLKALEKKVEKESLKGLLRGVGIAICSAVLTYVTGGAVLCSPLGASGVKASVAVAI